jgi:PAS domain S-box-containing protein
MTHKLWLHPERTAIRQTSPLAYLIAVASVALATVLRHVLAPWITGAQFITFFPAITLTVALCGARAGLVAVALTALAARFILGPPAPTPRDDVALAMFIAVGLLDVVVLSALLRSNAALNLALDPLRRANQDLMASEARFGDLLESAADAVVIVDRGGFIVRANGQTERLFGFPRQDLVGQPVERLIPDSHRASHARFVRDHMASPQLREMGHGGELQGQTASGATFPVEVSLTPLYNDAGLVCAVIRDVSLRKAAEDHQTLLIHELNHRVKNTLATVQSIARQTLKSTGDPAAFCEAFTARLVALSQSHDVLTRNDWIGATLSEVLLEQLRPYQNGRSARFELSGPPVSLTPRVALALGMVFGELSTNAARYGALSNDEGRLLVEWRWLDEPGKPTLSITWREVDGPPVAQPNQHGFGERLILRSLSHELGGSAVLTYTAEGLICDLRFAP